MLQQADNVAAIRSRHRWRLKAEEVCTQAEAFSSTDARDTMKTVAETWGSWRKTWSGDYAEIVSGENQAERAIEAPRPALQD
jgi:hypothetical protein